MKHFITMIIAFLLLLTTGCSAHNDIYIVWNGSKARISGAKSKVNVTTDKGGLVRMSVKGKHKGLRIHLSGNGEGQFIFTPIDDSEVILEGLTLHCDTSYAIVFKGKSTANITLSDGSTNTLSDEGIKTKGNLCISGYGMLDITCTANGHKGMRIGGNLYIYGSPKLCVTTSGNPEKMEEMKAPTDMKMPQNVVPPHPLVVDSTKHPRMPQGVPVPSFVRYNYSGTSKGVKVSGSAYMSGGSLRITTHTPGAEGLETKDSLFVSGGNIHVEAYDDAISVGLKMIVSGGTVYAVSQKSDGIDINGGLKRMGGGGPIDVMRATEQRGNDPMQTMRCMMQNREPTYIQTGGTVTCRTLTGPPEEALDTDDVPILHTGGTLNR